MSIKLYQTINGAVAEYLDQYYWLPTPWHVLVNKEKPVFEDSITLAQLKRSTDELVSYVFRACSFPFGCLIMTGTGIVPGNDFTLQIADVIHISIDNIGTLINTVKQV